jgi:hypothetical protein
MRTNQQAQPSTNQQQYQAQASYPTPQYQPQEVMKTVSFNPPQNDSEDPLVDLVGRMSELNANDKAYAMAYAQLWSRYPEFAKNMPMAKLQVGGFYVNQQGQTVRANQPYGQQTAPNQYAPARPPRLCFFCNKPAPKCFGIKSCKEVAEYAKAGKILYNALQ